MDAWGCVQKPATGFSVGIDIQPIRLRGNKVCQEMRKINIWSFFSHRGAEATSTKG